MEKKEIIILPENMSDSLKNLVMEEFGTKDYFYFFSNISHIDSRLIESSFMVFIQNWIELENLRLNISKGSHFVFYGENFKLYDINEFAKDYRTFYIPFQNEFLLKQTLRLLANKRQTEMSVIEGFESIRNNEEKFRSFVRNISDIITLVDEKGNILYQSASMMQKMGYGENELKGKSIFEIIHPEDIEIVSKNFRDALQNQSNGKITELRLRDKNGDYLYLEANGNNQFDNPLIGAFIINSRDITKRKIAEKERMQLIEELSKSNKELRQFSFITTHNMRAPLTNLMAIVDLINKEGIEVLKEPEVIYGLENSVQIIDETLRDLIKILIIRDHTPANKKNLVFDDILESTRKLLCDSIRQNQVQIIHDFKEVNQVEFDESYLESIFVNLIKNSIQFKHPERDLLIKIKSFYKNDSIHLRFSDNGIGLDLERVKDRLFGLYQRFHSHSKKGFGLYLIASQIQSLGGSIVFEESNDNGSSILINFKSK
jgi:PAS domain S-box-containing protein